MISVITPLFLFVCSPLYTILSNTMLSHHLVPPFIAFSYFLFCIHLFCILYYTALHGTTFNEFILYYTTHTLSFLYYNGPNLSLPHSFNLSGTILSQRRRLQDLQEQHADLLSLLAQQEVELGVFRSTIRKQVPACVCVCVWGGGGIDRKSTRLNTSHLRASRMPSSA